MIETVFAVAGCFFGFAFHAVLTAHKFKVNLIARKGTEVSVVTTKGERKFKLALDLATTDTYAILQTEQSDSGAAVTFAVKAEKVKV